MQESLFHIVSNAIVHGKKKPSDSTCRGFF